MNGSLATVSSHGTIDLDDNTIDMRLTVTPKLGAGVAVGAAIVTLNPIVGLITYAAEWLLGQPFSKLFTFSYNVTGSMSQPQIKQIGVSEQIVKNVTSTVKSSE